MIIQSQYIKAYFNEKMSHPQFVNVKPKDEFFKKGEEYILQGVECDDFTMPTRKYKLVGVVNEFEGIVIDSVIMKQIEGPQSSMIFTLTKNDCKKIGIEFEQGLQLFPKSLAWVKNKNERGVSTLNLPKILFNENDLSTYPVDYETKKIKYMAVKISGFLSNCDDLSNLEIRLKSQGKPKIPFKVITKFINSEYNLVDNNGNVFVECHLRPQGILPNCLKNMSINDLLEIRLV